MHIYILMRELDPTTLTQNPRVELVKDILSKQNPLRYNIYIYIYIRSDARTRPHHVDKESMPRVH